MHRIEPAGPGLPFIARAPRFVSEQLAVTVTAEWIPPGRHNAINISSSGILINAQASPVVGSSGRVIVRANGLAFPAEVAVARCVSDPAGLGHYVGLRFCETVPRIQVVVTEAPLSVSPGDRPSILLPPDKTRRLLLLEAVLKFVTQVLIIVPILFPLVLAMSKDLFGDRDAGTTLSRSIALPVFVMEFVFLPFWLWRLARDLHHGTLSLAKAIWLFLAMASAIIVLNFLVYYLIQLTPP